MRWSDEEESQGTVVKKMMGVAAPNEWTQVDDGMFHHHMASGSNLPANPTMVAAAAVATAAGGSSAAAGPSTAGARAGAMERPAGQDGQALRCPRCDSSNTKFCYYNNYSLSQPRHFCKACKRYWTRGGTLRNVPVGGGCRKNKRVKKPAVTTTTSSPSSSVDPSPPTPSLPFLPNPAALAAAASSSSDLGLLLYSLANPVSDVGQLALTCSTYELQPQLGALGLGFPSNAGEDYICSLKSHLTQAAPAATTTSVRSPLQENSLFGPADASNFAPSLKQQRHRLVQNPDLPPYMELNQPAVVGNLPPFKDVKVEGDVNGLMGSSGRNILDWQFPSGEHALESIAAESSLYWNAAATAFGGGTVWPDAAACGSSITHLI